MNEEEHAFNQRNIAEFRATGGRISAFGDAPVLLLTTVGAKSGAPRTNPLMYLADDDAPNRVYVFASAGGADKNPGWFYNVVADPAGLTVEIGDEKVPAEAEILPEPQREEIYAVQESRFPNFRAYREGTSRTIPVVALTLRR